LLEEVHTQLLAGEISLQDSRRIRWQRFLDECHDPERNHDPITISSFYLKAYYASERVVPGTLNLLSELRKDYTIGIISNNLLDEQLKKMRRLGISEYIDLFAISEEVGAAKPDPKIFKVALDRAEAKAGESVFIGDSWNTDVLGALHSGIRPIWLNRTGAISPDSRIQEISSLEEQDLILSYIRNEIPTPHITSPDPAKA
jgi:putative hydrolase of the HAD superfamily